MRHLFTLLIGAVVLTAGCSRGRSYELKGQVLAVDPVRREVTIRHEDIAGFMPAMTMPFKVRDARLLDHRVAGDLVTAKLVVEERDAFLLSVAKTGHAALTEPPPPAATANLLEPGSVVRDVTVTDETGRERRLSEWRGRTVAVTFIYTRCPLPDFCPRMDRNFAAVQREVLADPKLRDSVRLVSVSFDPRFDTPRILAAHARRVMAVASVWSVVTGTVAEIDPFASQFGVSVVREDSDVKEILHNLRTAVIGADGRLVKVFNGNEWTPAELVAALRDAGE